ncbi:MAG: glycine zipper domain-containing protein [Pseudomonadales bacterium]
MTNFRLDVWVIGGALITSLVSGCADLPGSSKEQGVVVGSAAGAAAGAMVAGGDHRLLGALLGGLLGAGGGYMIGANRDQLAGRDEDRNAAQAAIDRAQRHPATVGDVGRATTADLNSDGFVTADEIIAMSQARLTDTEMLSRLRATGHVFELTEVERGYLLDHGVSRNVVNRMEQLNA